MTPFLTGKKFYDYVIDNQKLKFNFSSLQPPFSFASKQQFKQNFPINKFLKQKKVRWILHESHILELWICINFATSQQLTYKVASSINCDNLWSGNKKKPVKEDSNSACHSIPRQGHLYEFFWRRTRVFRYKLILDDAILYGSRPYNAFWKFTATSVRFC